VLAERGYEVRGFDISREMVTLAQSKVRTGWHARYEVADARDLPGGDGSVDAVVVSKLFQHIQDWKLACRELIRVVRPGSCVIQINDRGAFGNSVRRFFSKRADELGFTGRYLGLNPHSNAEMMAFMAAEGCQAIPVDMSDLRWDLAISHGEALCRIEDRLFAEFWYLPTDAYERLVADTSAWIDAQPNGRNTVDHVKPYLTVEAFRTTAPGGSPNGTLPR
jgi:SAM-dependent methyltransferase